MHAISRSQVIMLAKIITLGLLLGLGTQFLFAWTAPSGVAPTNNVAGPLTTALVSQYKEGRLGVNINYSPTAALEVGGNVAFTGNILSSGSNAWGIRTPDTQNFLALTPYDNTTNTYIWANQIKFNPDGSVDIPSIKNCASVETDGNGKLICGAGGAGGGSNAIFSGFPNIIICNVGGNEGVYRPQLKYSNGEVAYRQFADPTLNISSAGVVTFGVSADCAIGMTIAALDANGQVRW